jgi:two-component system, LytTR family, sensor kinase
MLDLSKGRMDHDFAPRAQSIRYPRLGILFVVWTLLGSLAYARYSLEAGAARGGILLELLGWLACYYPWFFLTPLVFRLEQKFPLGRAKWPKHVVSLALVGLPLSYLAYATAIVLVACVRFAFRQAPVVTDVWWPMPLRELALEQVLYGSTVAASFVIQNLLELREKERQAAQLALEKSELESSLRQAELETLRMRLNPHFLFNCLQNISILSQHDPKTASKMLTRLGDLLRVALQRNSVEAETTLEAEVSLTQAYVSIEKMRFGDRLSVLLDIASGTERALVPSFLLQPLVENAIKHGLRGARETGVIWIRSSREFGDLVLKVSDDGIGLTQTDPTDLAMGIGLGSTCERLARMYSGQHSFSIRGLPEGGTEVRITLPIKFKESATEIPACEQPSSSDRR